jgi:NAD+ synthase
VEQDRQTAGIAQVFDKTALELDVVAETERIAGCLRSVVLQDMHRQGAVVGISGGIDSAVVLALCVRAFGPEHVVGLLLPERESSPDSAELALRLAEHFGVPTVTEDITAALEGAGCYRRRDEAIARVFPQYGPGWKSKIGVAGNLLDKGTLNVFAVTVVSPTGESLSKRLPLDAYYQIVAASNFKQRTRMAMLYYHAELRNWAVMGTSNKNEYELGFFVKHGDGGADFQVIEHLFKSQVYQLARYLGVPEEIQQRTPTTDTYSAGSTQEEFFFRVPFNILDLVWLGYERGVSETEIAAALALTVEQVQHVVADIVRKKRGTEYLRAAAVKLDAPLV